MSFCYSFTQSLTRPRPCNTCIYLRHLYISSFLSNRFLATVFLPPSPLPPRTVCLKPLHWACSGSRTETAAFLLEKSANPAAVDDSGWTPLHIASSVGAVDIVGMLLKAGVEIEAKNESG